MKLLFKNGIPMLRFRENLYLCLFLLKENINKAVVKLRKVLKPHFFKILRFNDLIEVNFNLSNLTGGDLIVRQKT